MRPALVFLQGKVRRLLEVLLPTVAPRPDHDPDERRHQEHGPDDVPVVATHASASLGQVGAQALQVGNQRFGFIRCRRHDVARLVLADLVQALARCVCLGQTRHREPLTDSHSAVITGASSGLGKALAFELAARGYALGLASRRIARLEELEEVIELTDDERALAAARTGSPISGRRSSARTSERRSCTMALSATGSGAEREPRSEERFSRNAETVRLSRMPSSA